MTTLKHQLQHDNGLNNDGTPIETTDDKVAIVNKVKQTAVRPVTQSLQQYTTTANTNSTGTVGNRTNINVNTPNKDTRPTPTAPVVNIDTSKLDTKKELNEIAKTNVKQHSTLNKSLNVQGSMDNKLGELIELNKQLLTNLGGGSSKQPAPANNRVRATTPKDVVDHSVSNF